MHFIEVTREDGRRARIRADAITTVLEERTGTAKNGNEHLSLVLILQNNNPLKVRDDTMEGLFARMEAAHGQRIHVHPRDGAAEGE